MAVVDAVPASFSSGIMASKSLHDLPYTLDQWDDRDQHVTARNPSANSRFSSFTEAGHGQSSEHDGQFGALDPCARARVRGQSETSRQDHAVWGTCRRMGIGEVGL